MRGAWQEVAWPEVEFRQQGRRDTFNTARRAGVYEPNADQLVHLDGACVRINEPVLTNTVTRE